MVNKEELKQILHEEEMKEYSQIVAEKYCRNKELDIDREALLAGPTEYINLLRKAPRVTVSLTDIAAEANPYQSKVDIEYQKSLNMLGAHYDGLMHGMYIRIALLSLLGFVYIYG